jgi:hypothetical protein
MDKIDRAGEALVEGCVRGQPRTFKKPKEERALGRWITLVSILLDQTTPTPSVAPRLAEKFRETRELPKGTRAWIAATLPPATGYELNAWPRPVRLDSPTYGGDGYFCTFRIQHLVVQAFIPPDWALAGKALTLERPDIDLTVRQVVPPPPRVVSWPPPQLLPPDKLREFAEAFINNRQ